MLNLRRVLPLGLGFLTAAAAPFAFAHEFPLMPGGGASNLTAKLNPGRGGTWGKAEEGFYPTKIQGLAIKDVDAVSLVPDSASPSGVSVQIEGIYDRDEEWSLMCQAKPVTLKPVNGSKTPFKLLLAIDEEHLKIDCTAVDPSGQIGKDVLNVELPVALDEIKKTVSNDAWRKHTLMFFVGPSFLSYSEDGLSHYSQWAANVSAGYQLSIPKTRFSVMASMYITGLPFMTNFGGSSAYSNRTWEFGAMGGYQLPWPKSPWALTLRLGMYYKTMMTTSDSFGFTRMIAPTFMPVLQKQFSNGNTGFAYLRYSPTLSTSVITFQNIQIVGGVGYIFKLKNGWELTAGARGVYTGLLIDTDSILSIDAGVSLGIDLWPYAVKLKEKVFDGSGGTPAP